MVTNPCTLSSTSSTAKPPVNDKSSLLLISDDEAEQQTGFDDSLMIVEYYEAPERNSTDYGDEDVLIIDKIPDIPDLPEGGNDVLENVVTVKNKENKETHPTKEYVVTENQKKVVRRMHKACRIIQKGTKTRIKCLTGKLNQCFVLQFVAVVSHICFVVR